MRIALPPLISPAAFADRVVGGQVIDLAGEAMGTRWSVRAAVPPGFDVAAARAAIVARLDGLVAEMSHWSPTSLLSRFNRSAAGTWSVLPADFAAVMTLALDVAGATGGAFDPAIGRLVDLHGFGPAPAALSRCKGELAAVHRSGGWRRLAWHAPSRCLRQPGGLWLDLSGIAKGHAVDAVADLLERTGLRHALVEIGGELVGRGMRPDGEPWWVDLEAPPGVALPPLRVALHGVAVATSGDYRRGAHTLDPRTGGPVVNGVTSVSVIARTAAQADAWATALTVLGAETGIALASSRGIAARIVTAGEGRATEQLTPALAAMLAD